MSVTRRPMTLLALVVGAALIAGCSTPSTSSGGTGSSPTPAASSAASPSPLASPEPSASEMTPAEAFEDVPTAEGALNSVWIGDGIAVAGGFQGPGFVSSILVFDGAGWTEADVPVAPGQVTGIAKIGDRLIAVGNGLPDIRDGFIWDSADGRAWQEIETIEDAAIYDLIAGDGVIVAVGARLDEEMNATASAWSSTDGATWEPAEVAGDEGTAMGSVTTTADGFAATGDRPLGQPRTFWTATAPTSWTAVDNDLVDQRLPTDVVFWSEQFVIVGASGRSGDQHPFVALSADGAEWAETILSEEAEGYASAAAVLDERLVVAGVDADRLTLWTFSDGTWTPATIEPMGAAISALAWDPDRGLVGVGAKDGGYAAWSLDEP